MEMLLYLLGNWCVLGAASIILFAVTKALRAPTQESVYGMKPKSTADETAKLQISGDLRMMLCIGALSRVYWSCSPPRIWEQEELPIQVISIMDIFFSAGAWIAIIALFYKAEKSFSGSHESLPVTPEYLRWYVLTPIGITVSGFIAEFLPPMDTQSWPGADTAVVFNMIIDGLAMVPQMYLIAHASEQPSEQAGHFVGLLCVSRIFRMLFWSALFFTQQYYILAFIVPDVIHSFIMGDYLYLWIKKVKQEKIDPMVHDTLSHFV